MNKYLDKIASTKLVREIAKGSVKNLKDKLKVFTDKGFLRPPSVYTENLAYGTNEINRLNNTVISKASKDKSYSTTVLKDGKHVIEHPGLAYGTEQARALGLVPRKNTPLSNQISELVHQQGLRHEAYESMALRRLHNERPDYSDPALDKLVEEYKTMATIDPANKAVKKVDNSKP